MNSYLDCIPCFFKQALFAARAATKDEGKIRQVLDKVALAMPDIPLDLSPPEIARIIYSTVSEVTGVTDPLKAYKEKGIYKALSFYEELKSAVDNSGDPLLAAVKIAIMGNVMDPGANPDFDLEGAMEDVLRKRLFIDHYESFKNSIEKAGNVLYLGDNAGETVFDKILIETIGKDTVYAVRHIPIINDATIEDAEKSGIGEVARILSSGCDAPGTILKRCSQEFLDFYRSSDVIVSKGQGNFESLSDEKGSIFFLLMVKCPVIARELKAETGEMILKDGRYKKDSDAE
ncbi:MAG: DUF89 family protein [Deltaproteobacteria bacterium]|nr:DUF89 family protein [Deltaproteobacteria bacterium]